MFSRCVLVHRPSRLDATPTVLTIELHCGDGVFTKCALELGKAIHLFDGVMSHSLIVGAHPRHGSELKFPRGELNGTRALKFRPASAS
jgi:hypothetical protein